MWLCTKYGFYSITQKLDKKTKKDAYHVRTRERQDLQNLIDAAELEGSEAEIHENTRTDYRYRTIVGPGTLMSIMCMLATDLDYGNFKSEVFKWKDQAKKTKAYHNFWHDMGDTQPGGPYGNKDKKFGKGKYNGYSGFGNDTGFGTGYTSDYKGAPFGHEDEQLSLEDLDTLQVISEEETMEELTLREELELEFGPMTSWDD